MSLMSYKEIFERTQGEVTPPNRFLRKKEIDKFAEKYSSKFVRAVPLLGMSDKFGLDSNSVWVSVEYRSNVPKLGYVLGVVLYGSGMVRMEVDCGEKEPRSYRMATLYDIRFLKRAIKLLSDEEIVLAHLDGSIPRISELSLLDRRAIIGKLPITDYNYGGGRLPCNKK